MIIARLWGGLGNQLFQYAAGYALSRHKGVALLIDPLQCHLDKNRPYELKHFHVTGRPWTAEEEKHFDPWIRLARPADAATHRWAGFAKRHLSSMAARYLSYAADRHAGYQPEVFDARGHVYMAGTWADQRYFASWKNDLREELRFTEQPDDENRRMLDRITGTERAVCVHVRRGDYVEIADTRERFGVCSLDYYRTAIEYLRARVEAPTAFVFSDDPKWTMTNLVLPCETVYVTHNVGRRNHEDLRLMMACRHFVIANSTFSWWGAWLSAAPDKIVVAPRRWSIDMQTIGNPVPPDWVSL